MEAARGKRLLDEVEEMTLKEVLDSLRLALKPSVRTKRTHVAELDAVAARHYRDTQAATLALTGRSLPLIYKVVSTLVSAPWRYAVLVVDVDGCFDASRLMCADEDDLAHVYVQRAGDDDDDGDGDSQEEEDDEDDNTDADAVRKLVVAAQRFMLYDAVASASRHWWGTIVVGGSGPGSLAGLPVDVVAGRKGWLHIDREAVPPFPPGLTVDEALAQREARQRVVDAAGWTATSPWGGFVFHEG
ncbi:hypothetical protein CDD80_5146 [Ophiocordyceps camponoti-rufipedis]|uniref:Uncharacterized protein n=1 Tax=Ophiocordyceps camponoti-rufipedis TaxID=2004952 RepID=A0A2C5YVJ5_9HYPO|nr:hypothetical protein CDD80_5146 [Ophiocordyceps camponoti-rufipedis]